MLKVYSSSAGSGKTFTLTKEYLKIVLGSNDSMLFKKVLAITFTNDAAAEMKSRVLNGLRSISKGQSGYLKELLIEELGIDESEIENRAFDIFNQIIQNYGEFSIKTIDSFVNQVVKAFALDLGVPYNYEITFDEQLLLSEAIGVLLDQIGLPGQEDLTDLIVDFANEKIEDGKSWKSLPQDLIEFGKNITIPEIASKISLNEGLSISDIKVIIKKIKKYQREIESSLQEKAQAGLDIIQSKGLSATDFYGKSSGIYAFFEKISNNPKVILEIDSSLPNTYVITTLEQDKWYDEKKSICKAEIDSIKDELTEIANSIIEQEKEKYQILGLIMAKIYQLPLLNRINFEFQKIKSLRNEVILSEFNTKILKVVINEPIPFIYERLGEKFDHILIDEFQDTSNIQFFNLLPLIDNSISKNKFSMMVGDPKQSIYRWRGGNIHLMLDILQKKNQKIKGYDIATNIQYDQIDSLLRNVVVENLAYNYRSTKNIIDFNNSIFEYITNSQNRTFSGIGDVYSDYLQNLPENVNIGGCVDINFYEKEVVPLEENTLKQVKQYIEKGYCEGDIAVLCRNNSEGSAIADFLKAKGFEVNSADSLKLNTNPAIRFIVSFLEYSINRESLFKKFELYHFLKLTLSQSSEGIEYPEIEKLSNGRFEDWLSSVLNIDNFKKLLENNYFFIIEKIVSSLSLLDKTWCRDYVFAFLDLGLEFYQKRSKITQEFLNYWNQKKESFSIDNHSKNAIKITSIHKAKGLEFKVVILPSANWSLTPKSRDLVWLDLRPLGFSELSTNDLSLGASPFPITKGLHFKFGLDVFKEQEELIYIENLNLLYVALTRAVEVLNVCIPIAIKNYKTEGVGQFFQDYLKVANYWVDGRLNYKIYDEKPLYNKNEDEESVNLKKIENFPMPDSELKLRVSPFFELNELSEKKAFGSEIHAALERLKTQKDLPEVLQYLKRNTTDTDLFEKHIEGPLKEIIFHPELSFLFSDEALVKNEKEILSEGKYFRPDRIVEINDAVFVVDYKTGEKSESHTKQLQTYKHLLQQMGYKNIKAILIYLHPFDFLYI